MTLQVSILWRATTVIDKNCFAKHIYSSERFSKKCHCCLFKLLPVGRSRLYSFKNTMLLQRPLHSAKRVAPLLSPQMARSFTFQFQESVLESRISSLETSPTVAMNEIQQQMISEGKTVYRMGFGQSPVKRLPRKQTVSNKQTQKRSFPSPTLWLPLSKTTPPKKITYP